MGIKLEYIDLSKDVSESSVIIFQKNVATDFDSLAVAWKVIHFCGHGNTHPFSYPDETEISARDAWGNFMPRIPAMPGSLYHVYQHPSGTSLARRGRSTSTEEIQLQNDLHHDSINAALFKDGRLLALKSKVMPGQKAVFHPKPVFYLAVASNVEEGQTLSSAVISGCTTEISLHGVSSAQIVLKGGGQHQLADKFTFSLQNVLKE